MAQIEEDRIQAAEMFERFVADLQADKVYSARFSFKPQKRKEIVFEIVTNMPRDAGLDIESAFVNWVHRTDDYSFENFVAYIYSKQPQETFTVFTKQQYEDFISQLTAELPHPISSN